MASPTVLQARVKSVMSGDTIILAHPNDPRKERTLSLAFVTSPRLRRDDDEVSTPLRLLSQSRC
jgi:staphylococcal nuclease domain-containing protein 1